MNFSFENKLFSLGIMMPSQNITPTLVKLVATLSELNAVTKQSSNTGKPLQCSVMSSSATYC